MAPTSQGDDLDGNYALDESAGDEELSDPDGSSDEDEDGSDDDEATADDDDLRQSFKKQVGSINQRGDFTRGLRRLRRLGILKDGGDAGASSDSGEDDGSGDEDEEGEEEEEDEDEDGDEGEEEEEAGDEEEAGAGPDEIEHAPTAAARAPQMAHAERLQSHEATLPKSRRTATAPGELAFTYEAPTTHAEFLSLVDGRSASELTAVIERICACNAIALAPDNRQKLQVFFGVLLVHFEVLAQQVPPPQEHLDMLVHHLLVRCASGIARVLLCRG